MTINLLPVKTKADLKQALAQLDEQKSRLYQDGTVAVEAKKLRALSKEIEEMCQKLNRLRVVKIKLAFSPSVELTDRLWQQIQQKFGPGYILDFEIDEAVVGGAIIEANGKYHDFSLRRYFKN